MKIQLSYHAEIRFEGWHHRDFEVDGCLVKGYDEDDDASRLLVYL